MMKNKFALGLVALTMSGGAFATGCTAVGCSAKITRLYMPNSNPQKIYVGTDGDESLLNCQAVSSVYMTLKADHSNFSEIYSALLASQFSERTIFVRISEGSNDCSVAYVATN